MISFMLRFKTTLANIVHRFSLNCMTFLHMSLHVMIYIRILLKWEAFTLSNTQKARTTVDIYGQQYAIVGTESPSHIRQVAKLVHDKMREISSKNPSLDVSKLAVLTAVNAVNDYIKLKEEFERLQAEFIKEKD
jgi:cell division protein ZapA